MAVFGKPIQANQARGNTLLTGEFSVFLPGSLFALFQDAGGKQVAQVSLRRVDPREKIALRAEIKTPPRTSVVLLMLRGADGRTLGSLGDKLPLLEEGKN